MDEEARNWTWKATDKNYDELVHELSSHWDAWFNAVRIVEKVFDTETFEITIHPIKTTRRTYKNYSWDGGIEEIIQE